MTSSPFTFSIAFLISKSQFAIKPFSLQGFFGGLVCGSCWALGIITRICRPLAQASDTTYRHNDLQTQRPTELSSERIGEFRKLDPSKPHVLHLAWGQDAPRWHRSSTFTACNEDFGLGCRTLVFPTRTLFNNSLWFACRLSAAFWATCEQKGIIISSIIIMITIDHHQPSSSQSSSS